jgi:hypothetical protein
MKKFMKLKNKSVLFPYVITFIIVFLPIILLDRESDTIVYISDKEVIMMIKSQLEEAGFNYMIVEEPRRLQVTIVVDSTGGNVTAQLALIDEENDIMVAFISSNEHYQGRLEGCPEGIIMAFMREHNVVVDRVFLNPRRLRLADSPNEYNSYLEEIKKEINRQIQEFIEVLHSSMLK